MVKIILLLLSLITISSCHVLLQTANGEVSRGSFIYWSLNYNGHIAIQLISLSGDTDLYVSEKISKPDYDPEKYDLHSASCGIDIVHIPSSFKRPVGIGIYGHPSHENSTYLLEIYSESDNEDLNHTSETDETYANNYDNERINETKSMFRLSRNIIMSCFWAMMEILELLFS